ncbi:TRAP transporter permease [bacterium]|nr:TRAP transporter permease [bacterium]
MKNIEKDVDSIKYRKLTGKIGLFMLIFSVFSALIHIWYNSFGLIDILKKNSIHLTLMMGIIFLTRPASKRSPKENPSLIDWVLFLFSLLCGIYFVFSYDRFINSMMQPNQFDIIYGIVFLLLVIEGARRTVGIPLTLLSVLFLAYTYFGPYMPGIFIHQGFTLRRILIRMSLTSEGVLGIAVMISASYVFMFILFGSFLKATKASEFFNDIASALTGQSRGGPAKIAILASALTGTISGSSQANVATTGTFTIPLMKSIGYKPYFAGAVEAIASTGGILMPPVMGAAAFIMSSYLGISYTKIMIAGFTPAFLYYFALYHMVDLGAIKWGLLGVPKDQLPSVKKVLMEKGHLSVPLFVIIAFLVLGYSPLIAAFIGIVSVLIVSFFRKNTRLTLKDIIFALNEGARNAAPIALICGIVGFIIGSVGMTGIGQVIGNSIVKIAGENLFLTAFLCMITAIILGMGLPGVACYIVTTTIAAPALVILGVPRLAAHFFAFYFGTMSAVIPPVALTSFTAASIAKSNPNKTALAGLGLGAAGLLLPYMFIYNKVLLFIDFTFWNYIYSFVSIAIGLYAMAIAIIGVLKAKINIIERIFFAIVAILLIFPTIYARISGLILFGVIWMLHIKKTQQFSTA